MVYTETKPRGPIFIDFTGPGPSYALPGLIGVDMHDPRSHHARGPSFTMRGRWKEKKNSDSTPGPIYNPGSNMYNRGRDEGFSVTMKGRFKERRRNKDGPGPGTYNSNDTFLSETKTGPSFSMARRHKQKQKVDEMPGPNQYVPSFDKQDGKGYTIKGRYKEKAKEESTPGPMHYKPGSGLNRYGQSAAPQASLKGRNYVRRGNDVVPGPGKYMPQTDALSSTKALPAWSLSSRHNELTKKDQTPGPNIYLPARPSDTASAPAYSLGGKYKQQKNSAEDSPGPGAYNPDPQIGVKGRADAPTVSLKGRYRDRSNDNEKSPGPQTYQTSGVQRDSGPAFSMTGKPRASKTEDITPGPNQYFPTLTSETNGPSLKGRHKDRKNIDDVPGPGTYAVPDPNNLGPTYSIYGKWASDEVGKKGEQSPGPATYNPTTKKREDAGVSFGVRHSRAKCESVSKPPQTVS